MSDPRVFIVRHGETEWSLNGRHTGTTELPLTANGEKRVRATGQALVGDDRLIVPKNLAHIYVSPRRRAQRTLELLHLGCPEPYPWQTEERETPAAHRRTSAHVEVTSAIAEWDYGDYEGLTSAQVRTLRAERGLGADWDIWRDGCEGGESPQDVSRRLDGLIADIRDKWHRDKFGKGACQKDVLVVAHGHILRAFAARWVGRDVVDNPSLILEAGGVGTLSYEHHSVDEPAILLGGAFVVDVAEKVLEEKA